MLTKGLTPMPDWFKCLVGRHQWSMSLDSAMRVCPSCNKTQVVLTSIKWVDIHPIT